MSSKQKKQLFHTDANCFSAGVLNRNDSLYPDMSSFNTANTANVPASYYYLSRKTPYQWAESPDAFGSSGIILLSPAIFGGLGAFLAASLLAPKTRSDSPRLFKTERPEVNLDTNFRSLYKLELFTNVYSIIALIFSVDYIYQVIQQESKVQRFTTVLLTIIVIIFLFASEEFLLYAVCPDCFDGVVGKTRLGIFLNFLTLSSGAISVGESYGITPLTTGTKVLLAQESIFNLFIVTLLIAFLVE